MNGNYLELNVFFDIIGTIAFAISGAILGCRKKMDILGVIVLGQFEKSDIKAITIFIINWRDNYYVDH